MFWIFVAFLWQRRQISTEKTAWRKISTFSKRFAKQFTSSTTFLFSDFDYFFLGQFTTRTNFQRCKFYWNSLAEVPQNHNKKDAFFRNLPVKRSHKTVNNTKNSEISKSDKCGNLETRPKNSMCRRFISSITKNWKTLFCVSRAVNTQTTKKYREIIQKNSK